LNGLNALSTKAS